MSVSDSSANISWTLFTLNGGICSARAMNTKPTFSKSVICVTCMLKMFVKKLIAEIYVVKVKNVIFLNGVWLSGIFR